MPFRHVERDVVDGGGAGVPLGKFFYVNHKKLFLIGEAHSHGTDPHQFKQSGITPMLKTEMAVCQNLIDAAKAKSGTLF